MIFASMVELEVGKIYQDVPITDSEGYLHTMPIMVLREATYNEYLVQMAELSIPIFLYSPPDRCPYHYEISVD